MSFCGFQDPECQVSHKSRGADRTHFLKAETVDAILGWKYTNYCYMLQQEVVYSHQKSFSWSPTQIRRDSCPNKGTCYRRNAGNYSWSLHSFWVFEHRLSSFSHTLLSGRPKQSLADWKTGLIQENGEKKKLYFWTSIENRAWTSLIIVSHPIHIQLPVHFKVFLYTNLFNTEDTNSPLDWRVGKVGPNSRGEWRNSPKINGGIGNRHEEWTEQ